ncbi:MAG: aminotransferase class V-fold PLP-dependent enzyme [Bacteroidales bacterium]|nr:aminotransferase class V-fold PLP-dependent enzyme [Bacteroidales bacterium]
MGILKQFSPDHDFALKLDAEDQLSAIRSSFYFPEKNTIYLDGNSLGRLPNKTRDLIKNVVEFEWGTQLIRSWNEGWYELSEKISSKIARLIGADANEIATGDSTSLNLYKLAIAAVNLNAGKTRIVSDELNFPTDLYVLQGIASQMGSDYEVVLAKSSDGQTVPMEELERVVDENTAVVVLSSVAFKSAFMYDMRTVTEFVHSKGALIIWDLSHAAGAVNLNLHDAGTDMAIGCTYKYMNGGPGSPAYLYVAEHLHDKLISPVWGWFGEENPFAFNLKYTAAAGIRRFSIGTPPVLSLSAIEPGLIYCLKQGCSI